MTQTASPGPRVTLGTSPDANASPDVSTGCYDFMYDCLLENLGYSTCFDYCVECLDGNGGACQECSPCGGTTYAYCYFLGVTADICP